MSSHRPARVLPVIALLWLGACTAEQYARQAQNSADRVLKRHLEETLSQRERTVHQPLQRTSDPLPGTLPTRPRQVKELSLERALQIGVVSNRNFVTQRESLLTTALSLVSAGHAFSPQLSSTLGYIYRGDNLLTDFPKGPETQNLTGTIGVSQRFPYGGRLTVDGSTALFRTNDEFAIDPTTYNSSVSVRLTQPLLRGFGRTVTMESLVQAERNMIYAIRNYELFREEFSIDVARQFYRLVQQAESIENARLNLEAFVFGRRQAEALFEVGRTNELDVLRARRSELTSTNSLIEAEEAFELTLDQFKVFLGLSPADEISILPEAPAFVQVQYDIVSAINVALENRLDLQNRKEQLEDSYRSEYIAKDGLLPDLNLDLGYDISLGPAGHFSAQRENPDSYSAGVSLELPLDRVDESNNYRRAQIASAQAKRDFQQFVDNLVIEVKSAFRELTRVQQSLEIQRQLIIDQEKNVTIAQLRFEQGDFSNRDVVEAQQSLLEARNALIQERVSYEIARLELLRDLGILFVDQTGMFKE